MTALFLHGHVNPILSHVQHMLPVWSAWTQSPKKRNWYFSLRKNQQLKLLTRNLKTFFYSTFLKQERKFYDTQWNIAREKGTKF